MIKEEFFERSPVRCFEKAVNGGLRAGEMGLLTAKKGLGKTSVLVQFGVDTLLQDRQVVHVSFDQHSSNVISWYQDIFTEIAKKRNASNVSELVTELVRKRVILNFNQDVMALPQVVRTVRALAEGGIQASCLVIDGVNLSKVSTDCAKAVADYAKESGATVWFSATCDGEDLDSTLSAEIRPLFACVLHLAPKADMVEFQALKLRDEAARTLNLRLDAKTLLMAEK